MRRRMTMGWMLTGLLGCSAHLGQQHASTTDGTRDHAATDAGANACAAMIVPENPACPVCTISEGGNVVTAQTNPRNDGLAIKKVVVTVFDTTFPTGAKSKDFGAISLSSSTATTLPLGFDVPSGTDSATIRITYAAASPIVDALTIVP